LVGAHELADSLSKKSDNSGEFLLWEYHLKRQNYADANLLQRYLGENKNSLEKAIDILINKKVGSNEALKTLLDHTIR
jgi:hypothetical protein